MADERIPLALSKRRLPFIMEHPPISPSGYTLGTRADHRVGMHGKAAAQRAGAKQTTLVDSTGGDTSTTTLNAIPATNSNDASAVIAANFAKLAALVNELRDALVEKGIIKGGA